MPATPICGRVPGPLTNIFMAGAEFNDVVREGFVGVGTMQIRSDKWHQNAAATFPAAGKSFGAIAANGSLSSGPSQEFENVNELICFFAINPCKSHPANISAVQFHSPPQAYGEYFVWITGGDGASTLGMGRANGFGGSDDIQVNAIPADEWSWIGLHYRKHASTGFCRVYVDSFANEVLSFTGDTRVNATSTQKIGQVAITTGGDAAQPGRQGAAMDDIVICGRTLFFTGGDGTTPTDGSNVIDSNGSTAIITRTDLDPVDPTTGILWLENIVDSGPGFVYGHTLTFSGWAPAGPVLAANDIAAEGWWIPPAQMVYAYVDTTDGTATMSSSAGGGAKFSDINKATGATPYSFATANGQTMAPTTGSIEAGSSEIFMVGVSGQATQTGSGPTQAQLGIVVAGSTEESAEKTVNNTTTVLFHGFGANSPATSAPGTPVAFTEAEINSSKQKWTARS